jgi:Fe-S oxidoreductase
VELLDQFILHEAIRNRSTAALADFLIGDPGAILIVEFFGDSPAEAADKAERFAAEMKAKGIGYAWPTRTDPAGQDRVWTVRKLGLGLMSNVKGPRKRQAFIEDACVPVEVLAEYIGKVLKICEKHEVPVSMYAHASVGVLHVDPMLDMHLPTEQAKMRAITEEVFELVRHYGGSFSGEHGDGIVRGEFLPRFFGPKLYQAFRDIKQLFDPKGLMNPGKIIDPPSMLEHLRYGPAYRMTNVANNFQYRDQGGFQLAVEQCNGVGACRKTGSGTMCPSYMATKDEEHCTRGRANALRLAMTGQFNGNTLGSDRIKEVLDLCLACKACKSECPNSVDMAKLKSDVLQMHHDEHGTPLGAKMIGAMPKMARYLAGPLAPIVNAVQHFGPYKWLLEKVAGIDRRRDLPPFTTRPFKKWYQHRATPTPTVNHKQVVLFADTYINYFEPSVGQAAVELLESCGYRVTIAQPGCCQRTRISKGLVRQAKRDGLRTLQNLDQYVQQGLTIVVCEPSCASSLTDDLPDLIDDAELGQRVASSVKMIDVFLAEELANGNLDCRFTSPYRKILLHGHCHQKALYGTTAMKAIYARVEGLEVDEVDSGCCGMAGSFGYEHFELSMKVAEDRLFPAVRNRSADTAVVASGLSCRHQMHDGLDVQACHWVQTVRGVRK